ncbi:hypothetical protein BDZ91DRAFT_763192 [Kalaharituber pfeilii]|nr:hypothetical protein BDZ91DRAFT_763192 [Kalaharituber pfeilii]
MDDAVWRSGAPLEWKIAEMRSVTGSLMILRKRLWSLPPTYYYGLFKTIVEPQLRRHAQECAVMDLIDLAKQKCKGWYWDLLKELGQDSSFATHIVEEEQDVALLYGKKRQEEFSHWQENLYRVQEGRYYSYFRLNYAEWKIDYGGRLTQHCHWI